jgi:hypothetical protein
VLWRRGTDLVLKSKSKNHIDMEASETGEFLGGLRGSMVNHKRR